MARLRHIEIRNFRSIRELSYSPWPGINCLVGAGDSGKSSVLDAIDLCLGARRHAPFSDTDFHGLNIDEPILISLTVGELSDSLLNLEVYGDFLRGFDSEWKSIEDEPRTGIETVLTLRLTVGSDLEPHWTLFSERAESQGLDRGLVWRDRSSLAPARIGTYATSNLSWSRNSVLNRLTSERADLGAELVSAAREARANFGNRADASLRDTLVAVNSVAQSLGVPIGDAAKALLDSHAVSIGDGAVALHNEAGIPLRSLGTGSSRLLVAGLQRLASINASVVLVDEVEYGLEPHRLARLLDSLGAKDLESRQQVFMTSHSPVALRELSGDQVFVVRMDDGVQTIRQVGSQDDVQATLRSEPEAFLARSILVCEGASEVGFARGLDQYWVSQRQPSFFALGGAYVDANGSTPDRCFQRATALLGLGYRVLVLVDADKPPTPAAVAAYEALGGQWLTWRAGRALEDELFLSLHEVQIADLIAKASELMGDAGLVSEHIKSKSEGKMSLESIESDAIMLGYSLDVRAVLGKAARTKHSGWFKSLSAYQHIGLAIVGPNLASADLHFQALIGQLGEWIHAPA